MANIQKADLVFIDPLDHGESLFRLLQVDFPDITSPFLGGAYKKAEVFLKRYRPSPNRKNMIITAGTIDSEVDPPGSAYQLVTEWLKEYAEQVKIEQNLTDVRLPNTAIIANPSFERRMERGFPPFDELYQGCARFGVSLFSHVKTEGPEGIIKTVGGWLVPETSSIEGSRGRRR